MHREAPPHAHTRAQARTAGPAECLGPEASCRERGHLATCSSSAQLSTAQGGLRAKEPGETSGRNGSHRSEEGCGSLHGHLRPVVCTTHLSAEAPLPPEKASPPAGSCRSVLLSWREQTRALQSPNRAISAGRGLPKAHLPAPRPGGGVSRGEQGSADLRAPPAGGDKAGTLQFVILFIIEAT